MKRWRLGIAAAGLLGLAFRCLYLWQLHAAPFFDLRFGDAEAYHLWAKRIVAGDWLGHDVFYQAPLYPYFLALLYSFIGDSALTVRIVHALLGGASCALLAYAGWRLFGRRGLFAGGLLAIYPAAIFLDESLDKTALATMLLCVLLALFAARRWTWAGLALALLTLTRENAVVLAIPLLWTADRDARIRLAAPLVVVLLLVGARNFAVGGEFHFTTAQSGPNLYIGNHAGAPGWYEPLVTGHGSAADERDDAVRLAEQARGRKLAPGEVSNYWTQRAFDFMRARPLQWLGLIGRKLLLLVNNSEIADTESQDVSGEWSWLLRLPLGFGVLLAAAALNWRGDRSLWAMAAVYALSVAAFYVVARYRLPLVPILLLLAVSMPWPPSRPAILIGSCAACVAFLPLVDPRLGRSTGDYAIATALTRDPARLDEAAEFYRRALHAAPDFPGAQFGLATVLTRQGHPADAIPFYESALVSWPDHQEAHYNLGYALSQVGREEEAARQFDEAVRIRPDDAAAHSALAQALLKLARPEDALPHLARAIELNPADAAAHENVGAILANTGRIPEAVPHFERAAALDPGNQRYRENLDNARSFILTHTPRH